MSEMVPEWDANFISVDKEFLMEIILAANFMDIPSLMELGYILINILCIDVHL